MNKANFYLQSFLGCSGTAQTLDFAAFNLEGVTPLHVAVVKDFVDIAKMLLSFGGIVLFRK